MKKSIIILLTVGVIASFTIPAYASDWDKFGKVIAVIEGLRVVTGGKVDVVGSVTGIKDRECRNEHYCSSGRVWVPAKVVWKKKYIPEHKEYSDEYGPVIVESHYIRYKVREEGYWKPSAHYRKDRHNRCWRD